MSISLKNIIWLAGLLEGEGTFTLQKGKYPRITVEMTDLDVVEHVRILFDPISRIVNLNARNENNKPSYAITVTGNRSIEWMMTIYPLMGIRRKARIREIIQVWKNHTLNKRISKMWSFRKFNEQFQSDYSEDEIKLIKIIAKTRKISLEEARKRVEDDLTSFNQTITEKKNDTIQ